MMRRGLLLTVCLASLSCVIWALTFPVADPLAFSLSRIGDLPSHPDLFSARCMVRVATSADEADDVASPSLFVAADRWLSLFNLSKFASETLLVESALESSKRLNSLEEHPTQCAASSTGGLVYMLRQSSVVLMNVSDPAFSRIDGAYIPKAGGSVALAADFSQLHNSQRAYVAIAGSVRIDFYSLDVNSWSWSSNPVASVPIGVLLAFGFRNDSISVLVYSDRVIIADKTFPVPYIGSAYVVPGNRLLYSTENSVILASLDTFAPVWNITFEAVPLAHPSGFVTVLNTLYEVSLDNGTVIRSFVNNATEASSFAGAASSSLNNQSAIIAVRNSPYLSAVLWNLTDNTMNGSIRFPLREKEINVIVGRAQNVSQEAYVFTTQYPDLLAAETNWTTFATRWDLNSGASSRIELWSRLSYSPLLFGQLHDQSSSILGVTGTRDLVKIDVPTLNVSEQLILPRDLDGVPSGFVVDSDTGLAYVAVSHVQPAHVIVVSIASPMQVVNTIVINDSQLIVLENLFVREGRVFYTAFGMTSPFQYTKIGVFPLTGSKEDAVTFDTIWGRISRVVDDYVFFEKGLVYHLQTSGQVQTGIPLAGTPLVLVTNDSFVLGWGDFQYAQLQAQQDVSFPTAESVFEPLSIIGGRFQTSLVTSVLVGNQTWEVIDGGDVYVKIRPLVQDFFPLKTVHAPVLVNTTLGVANGNVTWTIEGLLS